MWDIIVIFGLIMVGLGWYWVGYYGIWYVLVLLVYMFLFIFILGSGWMIMGEGVLLVCCFYGEWVVWIKYISN